jgi:hypothetical protein
MTTNYTHFLHFLLEISTIGQLTTPFYFAFTMAKGIYLGFQKFAAINFDFIISD